MERATEVDRWRMVERVLDVALTREPSEWQAVLDERCATDPELRREVEALLDRYATAQRFIQSPPGSAAAALIAEVRTPADEEQGRRVGPYRLVREIGRGGMARVYLAERADGQFTQRVALKLLRPGLDSEIDQGRFRAERQILASLSHPNIARLLDGGITNDGLPYLVLEHIDGQPIDRYCDERSLTVEQRLRLFLTTAEATQYAHRNLVVHRDLKPSNIFVTADGEVKLLDFGLAKLLEPGTSDESAPTTSLRWMTPEFAAPEQVRGEPVTTLTDVYQLGAVLYVLLTGRVPFAPRAGSLHKLAEAVLREEPALPSSLAPSGSGAHGTATAATGLPSGAAPRAEPGAVRRALRGDLDAIALKALRKEPAQRYASVEALADDVRRHLSGHPVLARRQTAGYRARRFVRRHRLGLSATAAIAALVATYAVTVTIQRGRVQRALAQAEVGAKKAEQVTDFMLGLFQASERGRAFGDTVTARVLLDRGIARARELVGQPEIRAQMLDVVGQLHLQLGNYDEARRVFEEALATRRRVLGDDHAEVATSLFHVADAQFGSGDRAAAAPLYRQALDIRRRLLGDTHPLTLESLYWLANSLHETGDYRGSRPLFDQWTAGVLKQPRELTSARADQLTNLGQFLLFRGDHAGAERLYREALEIRRTLYGDRHPSVGSALHLLGIALRAEGRLDEAERTLRQAAALVRAAYPGGHPESALVLRSLAILLQDLRRWDESESLFREVDAILRRFHGPDHSTVGTAAENIGGVLRARGAHDQAEPFLRDAVRIYRLHLGDDNLLTMRARVLLGDVLRARGAFAEAEPLLVSAYAALRGRRMPSTGDNPARLALDALVRLYEAQGREGEAAKYRALKPR